MERSRKSTLIQRLLIGGLIMTLLAGVFYGAQYVLGKNAQSRAQSRLNLYHATLTNALERYRHLPFVLAQDSFVKAALYDIGIGVLNERLAEFTNRTDLAAIYLMNLDGTTVATSNFASPDSFLGNNYGFRPYFQAALNGQAGQFFAIGVTTQKPGYFLSQPVYDATGDIIGVIAIKVDLSKLSDIWAASGDRLFVSNADGVIVLASNPAWRYQTLTPLDADRLAQIKKARQFEGQSLQVLAWKNTTLDLAQLDGKPYFYLSHPLQNPDWTLGFLAPRSPVLFGAVLAVGAAATLVIFILAASQFFRARRVRSALNTSQVERRKLARINTKLAREIQERRAAEARADKANKRLAQASKLAALGQLSASVTHELGQPISAMKNYLVAAELQNGLQKSKLINRMNGLVKRMESITQELRFFAKPGPRNFGIVSLGTILKGAIRLMAADFEKHNVRLEQAVSDTDVQIEGNRLRLEQVVVNLLKNAMAAIINAPSSSAGEIKLDLTCDDTHVQLFITDTGDGLQGRSFETLQEPFHTTRASGQGMGLGLAISAEIVKEHNGTLTARDRDGPVKGAVFVLTLPRVSSKDSDDA